MHQQCLHGVADGDVLRFAVHGDLHGHGNVCVPVYVHMADAVGMPQHGNAAVIHDPADEGVAAPGDNQVDQRILLEHSAHVLAGFQQDKASCGQSGSFQRVGKGGMEGMIGAERLAPTLQ